MAGATSVVWPCMAVMLKKFQYRPHLIGGCLAATGLVIEAW